MDKFPNKDKKFPVVLLLDTSDSMLGTPMEELNSAISILKDDILEDPFLANCLEVGIVAFDDHARLKRGIDRVTLETEMPMFLAGGASNLVAGMEKAMEMIEERKDFYRSNGEPYYRPFIVLLTDGVPTNAPGEIEALDRKIQAMSDNGEFELFLLGAGRADMKLLVKLAAQTSEEEAQDRPSVWRMSDVPPIGQFLSSLIDKAP